VAIQTPHYPPFLATLNAMGLQPVAFPFIDSDQGWVPDFVEFERSLRVVRPKVLILVNPHNPTGRVHTRTELLRNVERAAEFNLIVISDEIHAELIYAPHRHIPFASLSPDAASRTMTITSAGKAFNFAGLRCAVAHFGAESVLARRDAEHPNPYGAVSVAAVVGTLAAWQQGHDWQDTLIRVLDRNRHHVHYARRDAVPSARHHLPQGTYLSWVDVSALDIDDPVSQIGRHGKVMVDGGTQFGPAAALSDVLPGSDAGRRVLRRGRLGALGVGPGSRRGRPATHVAPGRARRSDNDYLQPR